jgi:Glyoxalase-like domain
MKLDHLAVAAGSLAEGVAVVEAALGMALAGGGQHLAMGTHNRLLGLGDVYLEVIAVDPALPAPGRPRWFDLDRFQGPPRLTNWIVACDDLAAALVEAPTGTGVPMDFARGDLRWQMAVPDDGRLPFDGAFPALIQWACTAHPTRVLPDSGARLTRLEIAHPDAAVLRKALAGRLVDPRLAIIDGPAKAMRANIMTPHGARVLE